MRLTIIFSLFFLFTHAQSQQPILVVYAEKQSKTPLDGRLILMISKNNKEEPRFQIVDGPTTQVAFGQDVENWKAGESKGFSGREFGYPIESF